MKETPKYHLGLYDDTTPNDLRNQYNDSMRKIETVLNQMERRLTRLETKVN